MLNVAEWIFSAFLCTAIVSFGAGYYVAKSRYIRQLGYEEARTRKWKTRAYKMAWGIPLDEPEMREIQHAMGPPKAGDYQKVNYRKTPGGLRTSCK